MAELTARPPFLDQLDHAARQAAAERAVRTPFSRDELSRARATARAAIAQRPDDWQLRFIGGRMLLHTGDPAGALEHLAAAVQLMPANPVTRIELANCLTQLHRPAETAAQLRAALLLDPENPRARAGLEALEKTTPAR